MNPIISHLSLGIACIIVGVALGWFLRGFAIEDHEKKVQKLGIKGAFSRLGRGPVLGITIVLFSIMSLIGIIIAIQDYRRAAECQSSYNETFTQALQERQKAAASDRNASRLVNDATIKMLNAILTPSLSVEERRKAIEDWRTALKTYEDTLNKADDTRDQNPLPVRPDCRIR